MQFIYKHLNKFMEFLNSLAYHKIKRKFNKGLPDVFLNLVSKFNQFLVYINPLSLLLHFSVNFLSEASESNLMLFKHSPFFMEDFQYILLVNIVSNQS